MSKESLNLQDIVVNAGNKVRKNLGMDKKNCFSSKHGSANKDSLSCIKKSNDYLFIKATRKGSY